MNFDNVLAKRNNKTVYRDGNRSIKLFLPEHPKADVLNEALNQARVEELGLNAPKLLEVTTIDGRWAIASEYIEGKSLAQLIEECPERKREYLELLADVQHSIHEKTCTLLSRLVEKIRTQITLSDFDATTRFGLYTRLEAMHRSKRVCHGDLDPSNIIVTEDGTPFVIDWSHAAQGNIRFDAVRTFYLLWASGDVEGANIYLDLFCEKSGIEKQSVREWFPLVAASQSVDGGEKEIEFLHCWQSLIN